MPRWSGTPTLRRHKARGLGVVTLNGRDCYLGRWPEGQKNPPPDVRAAYDRAVAEWLASGRVLAGSLPDEDGLATEAESGPVRVKDLLTAYWSHVQEHYRHTDGSPTSEVNDYKLSLRPLRHAYGDLPAHEFSPLKLKAVRDLMVRGYDHPEYGPQAPLSRGVINQRIGRIIRMFKWAVGEEIVAESVWRGLTAVKGLQKGRSKARETDPILPVSLDIVNSTLPHLSPPLQAAVRFQMLTGARPGEALALRLVDLERSGEVWMFRLPRHKTAWRGKERVIAIGPKAQAVLSEFIRIRCPLCGVEGRPPRLGSRDGVLCGPCADQIEEGNREAPPEPLSRVEAQLPEAFLFSPATAREEHFADLRAARKTRVQPSQRCRKKAKPERLPGKSYDRAAYCRAISRACEQAGVAHWHPNQLRHTHATEVRHRFGLEAAQVVLGHSQANVTQVYAERDLTLAEQVAREMG